MRTIHDIEPFWDAIVVGAGPAGSVAAMELVRNGWRTLLLDRATGPRTKCCGHCLSPRLRPLLNKLDLLDVVERASIGRTAGAELCTPSGRVVTVPFADAGGWVTPRDRLDEGLLVEAERRGVCVLRGVRGRASFTERDEALVNVRSDAGALAFRASLVVGADGLGSQVAAAAQLNRSRRISQSAGYGFSFTIEGDVDASEFDAIRLRLSGAGYLGSIRTRGSLHVAAMVRRASDGRTPSPQQFLQELSRAHPDAHDFSNGLARLAIDGAGPLPCRAHRVSGARVALVGDAAGYVEPFTGEGMSWAIESAAALGRTLEHCPVGAFGERAATWYSNEWKRTVGHGHRRCALIGLLIHRPATIDALGAVRPAARFLESSIVRRVVGEGCPA